MKLRRINLFVLIMIIAVFVTGTMTVAGAEIPPELDFVSENGGLPDNWEEYRTTFDSLQHPYLLVRESDFEKLQGLKDQEPWKTLYEDAKFTVADRTEALTPKSSKDWNNLAVLMGDNALLYILEPQNREIYIQNIIDLMKYWDKNEEVNLYDKIYSESGDWWTESVNPANGLINSTLALDIIYPDITDAQRKYCEDVLKDCAQKFFDNDNNHMHNVYGFRAFWCAYTKNYDGLYENYSQYMQIYTSEFTDDGFGTPGMFYSWGRYASDIRLGKIIAPLLVKKLGISEDVFNWEPGKRFAEFVMSYSTTPNGTRWVIGDSPFEATIEAGTEDIHSAMLPFYASYYGETASRNAAWMFNTRFIYPNSKRGALVAYLLCEEMSSEPLGPKSTVYKHGGAFMYENMENKNSLAGLLYNLGMDETESHAHNETNSLSVAAYGQTLLANAGYDNFGKAVNGFNWFYLRRSAYSANTVLIDYDPGDVHNPSSKNDHVGTILYGTTTRNSGGAGITKSLISDLFAYAAGDSGENRKTISNGRHIRNAALISTQDGVPGYFAVLDEITADTPGVKATVMWRPASDKYTVNDEDSWKWTVDAQNYAPADVTIHLTEKADESNIVDGVIGMRDSFVPLKCLESKFITGSDGKRNVGTIIFPSNSNNSEADISRFEGIGIKGSKVDFGNGVQDFIMYTDTDGLKSYYIPVENGVSYERVQFDGLWCIVRKIRGANGFMFATEATQLESGEQGFESNVPVSYYIKDGKGKISCSAETQITIKDYGIKSILVDGNVAELNSSGLLHTITLSEGEHDIEYVYDKTHRNSDIISSKLSNGFFDKIIAIDLSDGDTVADGEMKRLLLKDGMTVIDGTTYIKNELAESHFHFYGSAEKMIDGAEYMPLRKTANAYGFKVYWDQSNYILLVPENTRFDIEKDEPLLGLSTLIFDKVYQTEEPYMPFEASDIRINGDSLINFAPYNHSYSKNIFEGTEIQSVEADTDAAVEISMPDTLPGTLKIALKDGVYSKPTIYTVDISTVPVGSVLEVWANAAPQEKQGYGPDKTCDGDLSTRWSASGTDCWIIYDLGEEKEIESVETAWYLGNTRINYYDVEFSTDKVNWTTVFVGESSGTTEELEAAQGASGRARYVRLNCHGASTSLWNSLTECKINVK